MLSEEEKEINAKMDSLADEYMKREIPNATSNNVENLSFVFTYKKTANLVKLSENLVEHSKTLSRWTKIIAFTSIALIIFAIAQIILVIVLS